MKRKTKMEKALTPEQCKKMKHFLTLLKIFYHHAKKEGIEKPDIIAFMNAYTDIYGIPAKMQGRRRKRSKKCI